MSTLNKLQKFLEKQEKTRRDLFKTRNLMQDALDNATSINRVRETAEMLFMTPTIDIARSLETDYLLTTKKYEPERDKEQFSLPDIFLDPPEQTVTIDEEVLARAVAGAYRKLKEQDEAENISDTDLPEASMPTKPTGRDAGLTAWFDYYHACKKARRVYTLKNISEDSGYSWSYVRRKHAEYKASLGEKYQVTKR